MSVTRVRVRRERPTAVAMAVALCVTMLVVYVLTLNAGGPDVVESMAAAPRVTREIELKPLESWCVVMARCETQEEARLQASSWVDRGAAGYVAQLDGAWLVLGAAYDSRREAERIAKRLCDDEGIPAETLCLEAGSLRLRITAPEAQIEAVAAADALLGEQAAQLGRVALQLDRGEIQPDAALALCSLAAAEAADASAALAAIPGASENDLCAGLLSRLNALADMQRTLSAASAAGSSLSSMLRCAQIETLTDLRELRKRIEAA